MRSYKKGTIQHMSLNIAGCLRNYTKRKIKFIVNDHGNVLSDKAARAFLNEMLREGKRVIPMSDECVRFDYQNGCPGHIRSLMPTDEKMQEIELEYEAWKYDGVTENKVLLGCDDESLVIHVKNAPPQSITVSSFRLKK